MKIGSKKTLCTHLIKITSTVTIGNLLKYCVEMVKILCMDSVTKPQLLNACYSSNHSLGVSYISSFRVGKKALYSIHPTAW